MTSNPPDLLSSDAMTVRHTSDRRRVIAFAWPTGRPIYSYTVDELAEGVDLYTRALKARLRRGGRDEA